MDTWQQVLDVLNAPITEIGGKQFTPMSAIQIAVILILTLIVAGRVRALVNFMLVRRAGLPERAAVLVSQVTPTAGHPRRHLHRPHVGGLRPERAGGDHRRSVGGHRVRHTGHRTEHHLRRDRLGREANPGRRRDPEPLAQPPPVRARLRGQRHNLRPLVAHRSRLKWHICISHHCADCVNHVPDHLYMMSPVRTPMGEGTRGSGGHEIPRLRLGMTFEVDRCGVARFFEMGRIKVRIVRPGRAGHRARTASS